VFYRFSVEMAENSGGAEGVVDRGGGGPRGGAGEMTDIEAPLRGVGMRNFPHPNPSGNTEVDLVGRQVGENIVKTANNEEEKMAAVTRSMEALATAVNGTGNRKRLLPHERGLSPPKKSHTATPEPMSYAAETNGMLDKTYDSSLRARLEKVAPKDRMVYYDALEKSKRVQLVNARELLRCSSAPVRKAEMLMKPSSAARLETSGRMGERVDPRNKSLLALLLIVLFGAQSRGKLQRMERMD